MLLASSGVHGFYLPGVAPTDYEKDERVPLFVNSMTPSNFYGSANGLTSVVPYDYYFRAFHFCQPEGGPKRQSESLGSILFGDRIFNSPFELYMLKNETCKTLCTAKYPFRDTLFVIRKIWSEYNFNWLIDGLPAAHEVQDESTGTSFYSAGFPLGSANYEKEEFFIHNHYDIKIEYHQALSGKYRVVGVTVEPASRENKPDEKGNVFCKVDDKPFMLHETESTDTDTEVPYTYSVTWIPSSTSWATRWDKYLHVYDANIHWFSLLNSAIIVVFLTMIVSGILLRAIRKDIARYNEIDLSEDIQEDSGWKLVHGDVFRPPKQKMLLSVFLGSGSQLLAMTLVTLVFALFGFISPSNRGSLSTVMILFYTFFGIIGGYVSARAYKTFGGESWKLNLILTPVVVPGIVFVAFILLNFLLIFAKSSGAVPIGTMIALIAMWFIISAPLSVVGGFLGTKREAYEAPVRTNQIPRQIPTQPTYLRPVPSILLAGILPFCAIFVELYFILSSIWFHKIYYMFGFLFLCFTIMVVTSSTVTVLMIYFTLCAENYNWQWRSFILSGSASIYIFLHSIIYLVSKLSLGGFISNGLYLGYSLLISFVFFILTGTVGFIASFFFVRKIYSSIKID
ncbi:Emp70p [Sugiyamaella lignohabitans]|uniref:Transmembrane 9 superfamily member n=1 Tax=Sugiyamaella lignohabitans TaxID=796027 RepID=A0A161HHT7_9ASCO|nr:Emp70p [Sugiyamaella lignohabitans]ANB11817.1 Emp70p [Sugiyamaella lignohabitans]